MKRLVPLLLLATTAAAGDLKDWKRAQHEVDRDAKQFWDGFAERFTEAYRAFREPVSLAYQMPEQHKDAAYDYAGLDRLYKQARDLGLRRGKLDAQLDVSDEKARDALLGALLDACDDADDIEEELADGMPDYGRYAFDQEHGCRLEAIEARLSLLVPALARAPLGWLSTDAWKKCERGDGRKSVRRRVALLDAVAKRGDAAAIELLRDRLSDRSRPVRVAALEAMVACGIDTRPLLADEDPVLRRALLLAWAHEPDPSWFRHVLGRAENARGFERALCVRILEKISNQTYGDDLDAWRKWYEVYKGELEGGGFDLETVEVAEVERKPPSDAFSFYGLAVPSAGAVFVLDASSAMAVPADLAFQRTRWRGEWRGERRQWEEEHPAHQTVVAAEIERAFGTFPEAFRWDVMTLFGKFATKAAGGKRPLGRKPGDLKKALKVIERAPTKGWGSPLSGLLQAAALAGDDIDTIVLWHTGDPAGGRFMSAHPAADAWRRFNRFRKLAVVAVRIGHRSEEAETFMKRVAAESGGFHHWAKQAPASGG